MNKIKKFFNKYVCVTLMFLFLENSLEASSEFLSDPKSVECLKSSAVYFRHNDNAKSIKGSYGEVINKSILKSYADKKKEMVCVLESNYIGDRGFDSVLVDREKKIIVFMENKTATFTKDKMKKAEQNIYENFMNADENNLEKVIEIVKSKIDKLLCKLTDKKNPIHQLSRVWCHRCIDHVQSFYPTNEKIDLKKLINDDGYKFIRLASFTMIFDDTENKRTTTYYNLVKDQKSKIKTDSVINKDVFINAYLNILWDNQELSLAEAEKYVYDFFNVLIKDKFSVQCLKKPDQAIQPVAAVQTVVVSEPALKKRRIEEYDMLSVYLKSVLDLLADKQKKVEDCFRLMYYDYEELWYQNFNQFDKDKDVFEVTFTTFKPITSFNRSIKSGKKMFLILQWEIEVVVSEFFNQKNMIESWKRMEDTVNCSI